MTATLYEALRELAQAAGVACTKRAEDSGATAGEVFVDGELVLATLPCWVATVNGNPFKDYAAAAEYIAILCIGGGE